jgi:hypothetical protein
MPPTSGYSIGDQPEAIGTVAPDSSLSHHYIPMMIAARHQGTTDNTATDHVPSVAITDDTHQPFSQVLHGKQGRSDTVAAIKAEAGETIGALIKRLHPQLPADRLEREIKHLLQYNENYGNDLGDGSNLDGKKIYLNSVKLYDQQGRVTRIEGPTGRCTDITYDGTGASAYRITNPNGSVLEEAHKLSSGWQLTRGDQTQTLRQVDVDHWGDITVTDDNGNQVGHLTRGDDVLTKYDGDTPVESETLHDGEVTTKYQYEKQNGLLRVYAIYADNPSQRYLLDDTADDAMDRVRCGTGHGTDMAAAAAAAYGGDMPADSYVETMTAKDNAKIVAAVARQKGVDPVLAVATMLVESEGNNKRVGDNGTSFGLFQLHRGGELGNMSRHDAENPWINASTALSVFRANLGKYSDPGELAAASQRPADRDGYRRKVNAALSRAQALLA